MKILAIYYRQNGYQNKSSKSDALSVVYENHKHKDIHVHAYAFEIATSVIWRE